jgi:Transglutaminase-like superfamily
MASFLKILIKAGHKPHYIWLCLWSFGWLWWIDRHLQSLAIASLQIHPKTHLPLLSVSLQQEITRRVAAISWVSHFHPCNPKCLHQSLAIHLWLRRQGVPSELVVGWGKDMGHAWVSYGDQVLNDSPSVIQTTPPFIPVSQ